VQIGAIRIGPAETIGRPMISHTFILAKQAAQAVNDKEMNV
jgi:hypothetical protein